MNASTRVFLVILRLAIGWQLIVEANDKFQDPNWTSENYLRGAQGPAAPFFRAIAGDTLRDRLDTIDGKTFPAALENDWRIYLDRFQSHYELDAEQSRRAETVFKQQKEQTLRWLKDDKLPVERKPPKGDSFTRAKTVRDWLKDLDEVDEAVDQVASDYPWEARHDYGKNWQRQLRAGLKAGLVKQTATFKTDLEAILTEDQKRRGPVRDEALFPFQSPMSHWVPAGSPTAWTTLQWADLSVKWGLWLAGAGLIVGLLTRTSALLGAILLLSFVLAMPPLPWLAENPRAEGHYIYINKTMIEAIALLAIATTRSGRWLGIDGLLQFLRPRRRQAAPPVAERP